jgi:hypothetical protein
VGYHGSATHANSTVFVQQLPSPPITPPYLPGTASSPQRPHVSTTPRIVSRATTQNDPSSAEQARGNASPLKTFVHGVMHFSRTSWSVLYAPAGPRATQMFWPLTSHHPITPTHRCELDFTFPQCVERHLTVLRALSGTPEAKEHVLELVANFWNRSHSTQVLKAYPTL